MFSINIKNLWSKENNAFQRFEKGIMFLFIMKGKDRTVDSFKKKNSLRSKMKSCKWGIVLR